MQLLSTNPRHPGIFAIGQEAVGIIAFGQLALGVVAIGQVARGVFCVGQGAIGVFAIGQGAVGLVHGTGMVALAGNSGYGLALHLLPRRVSEPLPRLPPTVDVADLVSRRLEGGWIEARIERDASGEPSLVAEGNRRLVTTGMRERLLFALQRNEDRAHVRARVDVVVDDAAYRSAETHTDVIADDIITWASRRPRHWAYPKPPKGSLGEPASTNAIVIRTLGWLVALAIVCVASFLPLAQAFLDD